MLYVGLLVDGNFDSENVCTYNKNYFIYRFFDHQNLYYLSIILIFIFALFKSGYVVRAYM